MFGMLSLISLLTNMVACASADTAANTFESEKLRPLGKYDLERLKVTYTHLLVQYSNEQKAFCRFS